MKTLLLCSTLLLASCVTDRAIYGPDGRRAHSIECDGAALSLGSCYAKAGDICGAKGYDVLNSSGGSGMVASVTPRFGFVAPIIKRNLLIACRQ